MTSKNAGTNALKTILTTPKHWPSWDETFRSKAGELRLWKHIRPDNPAPFLSEPIPPKLSRDYSLKTSAIERIYAARAARKGLSQGALMGANAQRAGTRSQTVESEGPPKTLPEEQSDEEILSTAEHIRITDLDDPGARIWALVVQDYQRQEDAYERQEERIVSLREHVRDTVAIQWRDSSCGADESICQWYANLKKHVGADESICQWYANLKKHVGTDEDTLLDDLKKQYWDILDPTKKISDWEAWLQRWELIMVKAIKHKAPEVQRPKSWLTDFLNRIKPVYPEWSIPYILDIKRTSLLESITFRDVGSDFREFLGNLDTHTGLGGIDRGTSFLADASNDYIPQESSGPSSKKPSKEKGKSQKSKNGQKRKRGSDSEGEGSETGCPEGLYT
jgi:hypothetical protein